MSKSLQKKLLEAAGLTTSLGITNSDIESIYVSGDRDVVMFRLHPCSKCYFKLPIPLRSSLYQPFGSGYEEAYEKSLTHLRKAFIEERRLESMDP